MKRENGSPDRFFKMASDVYWAMLLDVYPSQAACIDFGITSQKHYEALHHAVREDGVGPTELAHALGNGERIQDLISRTNPHFSSVTFETPWDNLSAEGRPNKDHGPKKPIPNDI
jgi:hypothetical protein